MPPTPDKTCKNTGEPGAADDERFMRGAIQLAQYAASRGEVPIGALLVLNGQIAGQGSNAPIEKHDPTAHAEITAIRDAGRACGNYRLEGSTLYVTLEPCVMCAGALVHARVRRLVYGCRDLRFGGVRSKFRLADSDLLNHRVEICEGVLSVECMALLRDFFAAKR